MQCSCQRCLPGWCAHANGSRPPPHAVSPHSLGELEALAAAGPMLAVAQIPQLHHPPATCGSSRYIIAMRRVRQPLQEAKMYVTHKCNPISRISHHTRRPWSGKRQRCPAHVPTCAPTHPPTHPHTHRAPWLITDAPERRQTTSSETARGRERDTNIKSLDQELDDAPPHHPRAHAQTRTHTHTHAHTHTRTHTCTYCAGCILWV